MTCSPLTFGRQTFLVLPEGAVFWRERQALIVADLHLEKASAYATRGQMLPPYDSLATLATLKTAMERVDAREIWCLGDSLHDVGAADRMTRPVMDCLKSLMARCRWVWIIGNHDPQPDPRLGGETYAEAEIDGIMLRHEACIDEHAPELSGHFHPKWRMHIRGRTISRRCFAMGEKKLIFPAFGALTGGLDVNALPIRRLIGDGGEAIIPLPSRLLRFPMPAFS